MDILKNKLQIEQADKKLAVFKPLNTVIVPAKGWLNTIRTTVKMSLSQFGKRLNITAQSAKEIEEREANGSITLKNLKEAGRVLNMKLVYGFIPLDESIENMIEKRAKEIAVDIVKRTSQTMQLEDQENSKERLDQAIKNRTEEIKLKMPKYLWD